MTEQCTEKVHDWAGAGFHSCGNPAKQDGLCGVHLRKREQQGLRKQTLDRRFSYHDEQVALGEAEADRVSTVLGITATPYWPHTYESLAKSMERPFGGKVIVSIEDLMRLAGRAQ